jgi:hypothetical protein
LAAGFVSSQIVLPLLDPVFYLGPAIDVLPRKLSDWRFSTTFSISSSLSHFAVLSFLL